MGYALCSLQTLTLQPSELFPHPASIVLEMLSHQRLIGQIRGLLSKPNTLSLYPKSLTQHFSTWGYRSFLPLPGQFVSVRHAFSRPQPSLTAFKSLGTEVGCVHYKHTYFAQHLRPVSKCWAKV